MAEQKTSTTNQTFQPLPTHGLFKNDITGRRFERVLVLGYVGKRNKTHRWLCRCDCGTKFESIAESLIRKKTVSCGCLGLERRTKAVTVHGESYGERQTPEYRSYNSARSRCNSPTNSSYALYGGRGIQFRFTSFEHFLQTLGRKPSPKHSLDRIDSNGHYEPGNVRWATQKEQCRNFSRNTFLVIDGISKTKAEWVEIYGLTEKFVSGRLKHGWCAKCALTVPKGAAPCPHR